MKLQYQSALEKYDLNLTTSVLDGAFVSKARKFEESLAKGILSPEQIAEQDEELLELFNTLHEFEDVDAEEVKQLKTENLIHSVKEQAANSSDLNELTELVNKYKDYPELVAYIDKRAEVVTELIEKQNLEAEETARKDREAEELAKAPLKEKTKTDSLQTTLLSKQNWTYQELRELGITVTGDDMVIEEVYLQRQYLFKVYKVLGLMENKPA